MGVKCLAQEHNTVPRPGLEPGPFDPESSALTIRPPRLPHASHTPPLACAIFLQDLDPCLACKASSGYLLSFVLNISNEKRQVKELIELKNRPRSMSRNLYI